MSVIAFEGLDGVGKTTMARRVADSTGGLALASLVMPEVWRSERQKVNKGTDVEARFEYFLELNRAQMVKARRFSNDGMTFTMDSSIYRTVATHRVLGSVSAMEFEIPGDLRPDSAFLLELSETERIKRLLIRDAKMQYSSHWDVQLHERQAELRSAFGEFGLPTLDASQRPAILANAALEAIQV